ncbi:unnamed protein product [Symbiodinium sp. CCMP2456]|nr:unnamed protein product [Symbiodinium sp. CCMP2456]
MGLIALLRILHVEVAAWSCQQWTNLYDVLDAGCAGDAVIKAKREAASWDCPKWVNLYRVPDCAADQILSSPSCDEGCHRAFAADPFFVFRRCPETCTRGRNADSTQLAQSVPATGGRDAHAMASKRSHEAEWDPWNIGKWLPLLLLPFPFLLAARSLRRRRPAAAGEAGTPLHDAGDFSEFEGRAPVRSWWPLGSLG